PNVVRRARSGLMPLQTACPSCRTPYIIAEAQCGQHLRCGKCGQIFRVAAPAPPGPTAAGRAQPRVPAPQPPSPAAPPSRPRAPARSALPSPASARPQLPAPRPPAARPPRQRTRLATASGTDRTPPPRGPRRSPVLVLSAVVAVLLLATLGTGGVLLGKM